MNIVLEHKINKNGYPYAAIAVDLGYCKKILSFDYGFISELLEVPISVIKLLPTEISVVVGKINLNKENLNAIK